MINLQLVHALQACSGCSEERKSMRVLAQFGHQSLT